MQKYKCGSCRYEEDTEAFQNPEGGDDRCPNCGSSELIFIPDDCTEDMEEERQKEENMKGDGEDKSGKEHEGNE